MQSIFKLKSVFFLSFILLVCCHTYFFGLAHGADINISMAVRETIETRLLDPAINVQIGANDQTLQRNPSGKYPFKSNVSIKENPIFKVQITPSTGYKSREISIPASTFLANNNTSYDFFVAKNSRVQTYEYLDNGVRFHTKEFDKAFAYYEVAYSNREPGNVIRQYDIKLDYNYAVSVANTCLRLGYATCDEARELYKKLKESSAVHRNWFDKEKINLIQLDSTLIELSAADINAQYKTFKSLYDGKKYLDAVDVATGLLDKINSNEKGFSTARLTKDRLLEDIGSSYVKASITLSTDENKTGNSQELLQKAHNYYSEISVKSPRLTKDIDYIVQIKE